MSYSRGADLQRSVREKTTDDTSVASQRVDLVNLSVAMVMLGANAAAVAQELGFLMIGTGATSGTYFPAGGVIGNAISNPPGSCDCDFGGSCGVPGLIAVTTSTHGDRWKTLRRLAAAGLK